MVRMNGWMIRLSFPLLLVSVLPWVIGCGGGANVGTVSGTVTLDGEPVAGAEVMFTPTGEGGASFGTTDASGKYTLTHRSGQPGAIIGTHTVSIMEQEAEEEYDADGTDEGTEEDPVAAEGKIPERYNEDSTLTGTVKSGDNVIDFQLTTESSDGSE